VLCCSSHTSSTPYPFIFNFSPSVRLSQEAHCDYSGSQLPLFESVEPIALIENLIVDAVPTSH
jgi:hypothetical protein